MKIEKTFEFNHFPDFSVKMPDVPGELTVTYNNGRIGNHFANWGLAAYYRTVCKNLNNKNNISKIVIRYEQPDKPESKKDEPKNKTLF